MHKIDLMGNRFGSWIVVGRLDREKGKKGKIKWICQCKCGTRIERGSNYIRKHWNATDCGCSRSLVGKKFGNLTVIERLGKDSRYESNYICKCECGKDKTYRGSYLISGVVKTCGCGRKNDVKKNGQNIVWYTYRKNAVKRNIPFELTKDYFIDLIEKPCKYCNKIETNKTYAYKKINEKEVYYHNGIDRLDNLKGYTLQNSVPCCKLCNHMKWNLSCYDWMEHLKIILKKFDLSEKQMSEMSVMTG